MHRQKQKLPGQPALLADYCCPGCGHSILDISALTEQCSGPRKIRMHAAATHLYCHCKSNEMLLNRHSHNLLRMFSFCRTLSMSCMHAHQCSTAMAVDNHLLRGLLASLRTPAQAGLGCWQGLACWQELWSAAQQCATAVAWQWG